MFKQRERNEKKEEGWWCLKPDQPTQTAIASKNGRFPYTDSVMETGNCWRRLANKYTVKMFLRSIIVIVLIALPFCESRIRYKYRKRPECRDQVPRRSDELSTILVTGVIETTYPPVTGSDLYSASVHVKSVLKGPKTLQETRQTVAGFGDTNLCHAVTTRGDSWILSLEQLSDGLLKLNGTLLKVNLNNLDRLTALTSDEPFRRRPEIMETPCEQQYCANNGNCIEDRSSGIGTRAVCQCLSTCPHSYEPVCGSNGETFANDCRLRMDSCTRDMNIFTRHLGTCENGRRVQRRSMADLYPSINHFKIWESKCISLCSEIKLTFEDFDLWFCIKDSLTNISNYSLSISVSLLDVHRPDDWFPISSPSAPSWSSSLFLILSPSRSLNQITFWTTCSLSPSVSSFSPQYLHDWNAIVRTSKAKIV